MTRYGPLFAILMGVLETGCFIQVDHVADPRAAFRDARAEALLYAGRPGPARELNLLVYDAGERELVRVSLPMWVVRKLDRDGREFDLDFDDRPHGLARAMKRHVRLRDIERAGLGILLEAEEDEGGQVLIWLR